MNNDAFVKNVASRLIEQIRNGTAPWQRPWRPGTSFLPFNPTNGTRYKGINIVNLLSRGYSDSRWMTYRQAQTQGLSGSQGRQGHALIVIAGCGLAQREGGPIEEIHQEFTACLADGRTAADASDATRSTHRELFHGAFQAARQAVLAMRANDEIGDDAFHQVENGRW